MDSNESVKDKKNPNSHLKTYKWPLKYKWMIILFIVLEVKIKTKNKTPFYLSDSPKIKYSVHNSKQNILIQFWWQVKHFPKDKMVFLKDNLMPIKTGDTESFSPAIQYLQIYVIAIFINMYRYNPRESPCIIFICKE